jgi:hypothetical protein
MHERDRGAKPGSRSAGGGTKTNRLRFLSHGKSRRNRDDINKTIAHTNSLKIRLDKSTCSANSKPEREQRMWSITLVRESDLTTWNALARYPDAAMIDFARQTGLNLYICEGVSPYHIECRDMVSGTKFILGVVDGVPAVVATFHVVASGYTLTIVEAPDRVRLDVSVSSEDELQHAPKISFGSTTSPLRRVRSGVSVGAGVNTRQTPHRQIRTASDRGGMRTELPDQAGA